MIRSVNTMAIFCLMLIFSQFNAGNACTNFCMDTPNGPVFGSNLDSFLSGNGLVFINQSGVAKKGFSAGTSGDTAKWVSKYGSISFNMAGREFAFGGMNEAGLVVSMMELLASKFPIPDERPPLNIGFWAQYVLDNCATIEEVIAVDAMVRMEDGAPPVHLLIADSAGNCVSIEWLDGRLVYHTGEDLPVKAMSNSVYGETLAVFENGGPRWWQSDRGDTKQRFADAARRNAEYAGSGESNAIKYAFDTLTRDVAAAHTKWNLVYDISAREIWFRSAASPTVKHLSMNEIDFACQAAPLMLDINAGVKGNVAKYFMPYDRDINMNIFRALCYGYELNVSRNDAEDLMRLIEGFNCAE